MTHNNDGTSFARFSLESKRIKPSRILPKLFEPRRDGTLSVQNIDNLDEAAIKQEGLRVAKSCKEKKKLYGWAFFARETVDSIGLLLCIDNRPNKGHALITGWPDDQELWLEKQVQLVAGSETFLI